MDDELQQLEAELKRLEPKAPSAGLRRRVANDLAPRGAANRRLGLSWAWAGGLAAAAGLALLLTQRPEIEPPRPRAPTVAAGAAMMKPVAAENILVAAQDEGFVTLEDGTTARRARLKYVDTITWKNPQTNASLTWTVPREEVRVIPVSFQ